MTPDSAASKHLCNYLPILVINGLDHDSPEGLRLWFFAFPLNLEG